MAQAPVMNLYGSGDAPQACHLESCVGVALGEWMRIATIPLLLLLPLFQPLEADYLLPGSA